MTSNIYLEALRYAKNGLAVFPTHGIKQIHAMGKILNACTCGLVECGSPGKHPAVDKGRNASSKDEFVLQNLWAAREYLNVAIATGIESGIFVVDVDGAQGEESLIRLEEKNGKLPKTLTSITGRGKHLLFKYPDKKVFNRTNSLGSCLDIRGEGGYIIAPPSKHISGVQYKWEDSQATVAAAPAWLLELVCGQSKAPVLHEEALNFDRKDWTPEDVTSMLDFLDPDMTYSDWVNVGMAIQAGGFSFSLWDSWSKRGQKYDQSTVKHWRSFKNTGGITMGTLVDMAKIRGWKPQGYITEKFDWDTHPALEFLISIGAYSPSKIKKESIPDSLTMLPIARLNVYSFDPLELPGLIGETIRWINDTAIKPQPVLAMLAVFTCLGAVFGRRYASPVDTRTNLFIVGIAETGTGKDHARKKMKNIMDAAGLENYLASDDVKSGPGILTTLTKKPSCVAMIDEFGKIMQGISSANAASHKTEIGDMFLKLYSHAGSVYTAGDYADIKMKSPAIRDPNLCIYGTSTLASYIVALKSMAIQDGQLNRFIVLPGNDDPDLCDEPAPRDIPDHILDGWKSLAPPIDGLASLANPIIQPSIKTVTWSSLGSDQKDFGTTAQEHQKKLLHIEKAKMKENKQRGYSPLWARYRENTIKIAMLFAICRAPHDPRIEMKDFLIAEKIIETSVDYVSHLASDYMYESDIDRNKKEIYVAIRNAGEFGIKRSELIRTSKTMKPKDFDDVIKILLEEERIDATLSSGGAKNQVCYKCIG